MVPIKVKFIAEKDFVWTTIHMPFSRWNLDMKIQRKFLVKLTIVGITLAPWLQGFEKDPTTIPTINQTF